MANKRLHRTNFRCHLLCKMRKKAAIKNLLGEPGVKLLKRMMFIESIKDLAVFSVGLIFVVAVTGLFAIARPDLAHHLILLISAILIFCGVTRLKKYREQQSWIESRAVLHSVKECEKNILESRYGVKRKYVYPEVEYKYAHNGREYQGRSVADSIRDIWVPEINAFGDKKPEDQKPWNGWAAGLEVPVYVNPQRPSQAVLLNHPSKKRKSHFIALIAAGILLFFIWGAVVAST